MSTINSDLGRASQKATALKQATDRLSQSVAAITDTQTTVVANLEALKVIASSENMAQQIANAVTLATTHIQSIAEEFEALDNQVGQALRGNIGGLG